MARPKVTKLNPFVKDGKQYYLPNGDELYKEAVLNTNNEKCWFIYYSIWDFEKGQWVPIKDTSGDFNKKHDRINKTNRKVAAGKILADTIATLKLGISPKTGHAISPLENLNIKQLRSELNDPSPVPSIRNAVAEWKNIKSGIFDSKIPAENKENTTVNYNSFFNRFLKYCEDRDVADVKLHRFQKIIVQDFFDKRFNIIEVDEKKPTKKKKRSEKIGAGTWNVQLGWIKAMFNYYSKKYDYGDFVKNIEDKKDPEDSERYEPFSDDQVKLILNHLDNPQEIDRIKYKSIAPPDIFLGFICRTIYYTFLRPSEIRRLKVKHVKNYLNGFFNLTTDITKTKKKVFNDLYIQPPLVDEFKKLGWERYFKDKKYENYYIFSNNMVPSPVKSNQYSYSKKFSTVIAKLGIPMDGRFSLYSLKPTGNIASWNAGYDLFQISIQNRHTTTAQTETYLRKLKCNIAERPRPLMGKI